MAGILSRKNKLFIRSGAIRRKGLGYLLCGHPIMKKKEVPHTYFLVWEDDEWAEASVKWDATSACIATSPKEQLIALGPTGRVWIVGSGERFEEHVLGKPKEIDPSLEFSEVREIDGKAYAVDMDRRVFRRDKPGVWKRLDSGLPEAGDEDGLESIHGFSEDDLYAVGWEGQIWHFDGKKWASVASPTNVVLNSVVCAEDGFVYACGLAGVLLKGKGTKWKAVEQEEVELDLWDVEWFKGKLYVSTMQFLYTLEGDELELVEFEDEAPSTCYHLSSREGLLWSIGSKDVMEFDGKDWTRIE